VKLPQDKTLTMQAAVSIVGFIAFATVGVVALIYRNTNVVIAAISGMGIIYAHWTQSPAQQSAIASLVQQLIPVITSMTQPAATDATQPRIPAAPKEPTQ
jgi:hypothetical protein